MKVAPLCISIPIPKIRALPFFIKDSSDYSVFFIWTYQIEPWPLIFHSHCGLEGVVSAEDQIGTSKVFCWPEAGPVFLRLIPSVFTHADKIQIKVQRLSGSTPAHPSDGDCLNLGSCSERSRHIRYSSSSLWRIVWCEMLSQTDCGILIRVVISFIYWPNCAQACEWVGPLTMSFVIFCQQLVHSECCRVLGPLSTAPWQICLVAVRVVSATLWFSLCREMETSKSEVPVKSICCVDVYKCGVATRRCGCCKPEPVCCRVTLTDLLLVRVVIIFKNISAELDFVASLFPGHTEEVLTPGNNAKQDTSHELFSVKQNQ